MRLAAPQRLLMVLKVCGLRCAAAQREVERCRQLLAAAEDARRRAEAARDALQDELRHEMTRTHARLVAFGARGAELDVSANYTRHIESRLRVADIDLVRAEGEALRAEHTLQRARQRWREARLREERTRVLLQHAQQAVRRQQARAAEQRLEELANAERAARRH